MKYSEARKEIKTGDVLMVSGEGFVSKFIRIFTGERFSHVAIFIWMSEVERGGLWVAEMKEGIGFRMMPASEWVADTDDNAVVYWASFPGEMNEAQTDIAKSTIISQRGGKYGYASLVKVWWSQIRKKKFSPNKLVCSTYAQKVWESVGVIFVKTADPGDFMEMADKLVRLEEMKQE